MQTKVKLGVIGAGVVAERIFKAASRVNDLEIVALFDSNYERAHAMGEKYSIYVASSEDEVIERADAVYVATPPAYHHGSVMKVLHAKKHILCEKPLANSLEEAQEMLEATRAAGVVHGMNFPIHYSHAHERFVQAIRTRELGDIQHVEILAEFPQWPRNWQQNTWIDTREQGGFTREVFTHFIQFLLEMLGTIQIHHKEIKYSEKGAEMSLLAIGKIHHFPLLIRGVTNVGAPEELSVRIFGTEKTIELSNWKDVFITTKNECEQVPFEEDDSSYHMLNEFIDGILGKEYQLVDFNYGYETTRIIEELLG